MAGYGARLAAFLVDALIAVVLPIVGLFGLVGIALSQQETSGAASGWPFLISLPIILWCEFVYLPYTWAHSGASLGMRLLRLRVVSDRDGGPVSTRQAVLRLLGWWVSVAVWGLPFAYILIDQRRRGVHDLIAGTVVVKTP